MWIIKRASAEQLRLERLLLRQEGVVRRAFMAFLADARSDATIKEIRLLIERGQIEPALKIVDQYVVRLGNVIPHVFSDSARAEVPGLLSQLGASLGRVAVTFDPTNQRAANIMLQSRLRFIREFTDKQRQATSAALTEALTTGAGPRETARAFRDSIGLTRSQQATVERYRGLLQSGSAEALARDLRDRRFDPTIQSAITTGEPLDAAQIDRMVDRYRERMLMYRSENIARTETLEAVSMARNEALRQITDETDIPDDQVERTWNATNDKRTRDTHAAMDGQSVIGVDSFFQSPSGAQLKFPGDPDAPADEICNCFHPSSLIHVAGLKGVISRYYSGVLIEMSAAGGVNLAVTPNHPILTQRGWIAARDLVEGDHLIKSSVADGLFIAQPDVKHGYASAESLGRFAKLSGAVHRPRQDAVNLHGEVPDHQVEIVSFPGKLRDAFQAAGLKTFGNIGLEDTDTLKGALLTQRLSGERGFTPNAIDACVLGGPRHGGSFFGGKSGTADAVGFGPGAPLETQIGNAKFNGRALDAKVVGHRGYRHFIAVHLQHAFEQIRALALSVTSHIPTANSLNLGFASAGHAEVVQTVLNELVMGSQLSRDAIDGFPGIEHLPHLRQERRALFSPVQLTAVNLRHYSGSVYNFETDSGLILANGIVTHNCRCTVTTRILTPDEAKEAA